MNIVDYVVLGILALSVLFGFYRRAIRYFCAFWKTTRSPFSS